MCNRLIVITCILFFTIFLRIENLTWGLPYLLDGDEWRVINSGLSIHYIANPDQYPAYFLQGYPPFRLWEVALTRAVFMPEYPVTGAKAVSTQIILGRYFTIGYFLITLAAIYRIMRMLKIRWQVAASGILAITLLEPLNRISRLTLADSPALMFAMLSLWMSLKSWQTPKPIYLLSAYCLAVFAFITKYNYVFFAIPVSIVTLILYTKGRLTRQYIWIIPSLFIMMAILLGVFIHTMGADELLCPILRDQTEHCWSNPDDIQTEVPIYDFPDTPLERLNTNLGYLNTQFSIILVFLAVFYGVMSSQTPLRIIALTGLIGFISISWLQATTSRQIIWIMVLIIVILSHLLNKRWKLLPLVLISIIFFRGLPYFETIRLLDQPDSRAAVANWLAQNGTDGMRIASEVPLYEVNQLSGFPGEQTFDVIIDPTLAGKSKEELLAQGYNVLIISEDSFLNFDRIRQDFSVIAQFRQPAYEGPTRIIVVVDN